MAGIISILESKLTEAQNFYLKNRYNIKQKSDENKE